MDTVTITSRTEIALDDVRSKLAARWSLLNGGPDQVVVEEANSRVYIYHPAEGLAGNPLCELFLDFSSVALVNKVIETIADDPQLTVDADFGIVLPGDEFVARVRSSKEWDWRREWLSKNTQN